ncbi:hypothetical protein Dimus_018753 [Dionaea muscipula]
MELIKRQKWENLFKRREFVFIDAVKEFYAKMTVIHLKKKDVVKSSVKGVAIEFDHDRLASILGVPGKNGICEYIKDVWEESKYTKPLEITRRFANNETLTAARRVKSGEMKPFQRFIHFLVMKNVIPRFRKRYTSSFMDLTYMDHLMERRLVNLPRVMMRHMSYVISMKDHELPYGDWLTMVFEEFDVPLVDKKGEEPKRYDYFEETFLTMCKLTRANGVWWVGTGENGRRDDVVNAPEEEDEEEGGNQAEFDWEAVIDEAAVEGESRSDEQFYDAQVDVEEPVTETPAAPEVVAQASIQRKETTTIGVDPRVPPGRIPFQFQSDQLSIELAVQFWKKQKNKEKEKEKEERSQWSFYENGGSKWRWCSCRVDNIILVVVENWNKRRVLPTDNYSLLLISGCCRWGKCG